MINFDAIFAEVYATRQLNELERKRWAGLTAEQRTEELRVREVKALERLAAAAENPRREVHHHFFL